MTAVNISGTFKKDEKPYNGLVSIAKELTDRDRRLERYVVVAVIRPHAGRWLADDGTETPTIRFDHIEVLDGTAADTARALLNEAYRARTGRDEDPQDTLPLGDADAAAEDGPVAERPKDEWLDNGQADKPKRGRR